MAVLPLLAVGILMKFLAVLFVLVSIVLILVILIQKGRGGGLSGAFGGGMASGLLGTKTGDFLTWVTIVGVAVFLILAVLLARFYKPAIGEYGAQPPAPTQQPAPEGAAPAPQGESGASQAESPAPPAESAAPTTPGADANSAGR